jgi:hypothetical protein
MNWDKWDAMNDGPYRMNDRFRLLHFIISAHTMKSAPIVFL